MSRIMYIWVVAYINADLIKTLKRDISQNPDYRGVIEASIPTVRVLKKQIKGKNQFDEVPLLFNYGFFRVPLNWAINQDIMTNIKNDIGCISNWVVETTRKSPSKRNLKDNSLELLSHVKYSYIRGTEVRRLNEIAKSQSIHSDEDIEGIIPGSIITLVGYPFDGMEAEIISVDKAKGSVRVKLFMFSEEKDVTVSLDNVLYTIYKGGYNEEYSRESAIKDYQEVNYTGDINEV